MNITHTLKLVIILCTLTTRAIAYEALSLQDLLEKNPKIEQQKLSTKIKLKFDRFPIASSEDSTWDAPIIPETFILKIPRGKVFSPNGIVVADGYLTQELIWPWSPIKRNPSALKELPPAEPVKGNVVVLAQEGHRNYYHWLTEVLPKFALLEQSGAGYDFLYLPDRDLPFQRETLDMLGIDEKKIITGYKNTCIEADTLIVPSFASRSCVTPPWIAQYIRKQLMKHKAEVKDGSKKIFISRSKAPQRRITNEGEIQKWLENQDFKTVHLEALSVREQMAVFEHADLIVAPHGAGLANLLFANPGTQVIEIFQALEDDSYCYLSQTLDLKYHCIATTPFLKDSDKARKLDTEVDWEKLRPQLEALLSPEKSLKS
ncbi:MAG TPA: hypothetical protein DIU37_03025 [Opitutae bacterium]|nr:hypothetical protein [Opitutae bacterium]|tara:strand:+ start:1402 stop:2523 length:1122 start_codon:yes stop_codon:yes gene_type:complete